jgi:cell division inhibitor SepF
MSSWWRQAMLYLGLGPDEEYEDYETRGAPGVPEPGPGETVGEPVDEHRPAPVRPVASAPEPAPEPEPALSAVRPIRDAGSEPAPVPEPSKPMADGSVRAIPVSSAKPHVILPTSFTQAQEVGDRFKGNQPVIINLQAVDRDLARRLIDFASGLCYGIGGQMERVAKDVYLLTPADVQVSDEDRRRLTERGLHDG